MTHDIAEGEAEEMRQGINSVVFDSLQGRALLLGAHLGNIGYRLRHAAAMTDPVMIERGIKEEMRTRLLHVENEIMRVAWLLDGMDEQFCFDRCKLCGYLAKIGDEVCDACAAEAA